MGRFIGRIHAVGELHAFNERGEISIHSFGEEPRDFLKHGRFLPADLSGVYFGVVDQALDGAGNCFERAGDVATLRLHGDCHAGNVLWVEGEGGRAWFVDFRRFAYGSGRPGSVDAAVRRTRGSVAAIGRCPDELKGLPGVRRANCTSWKRCVPCV